MTTPDHLQRLESELDREIEQAESIGELEEIAARRSALYSLYSDLGGAA